MTGLTPEQRREVAEIVSDVLMSLQRYDSKLDLEHLEHRLDWALHNAGYQSAEAPDA